MKNHNKLHKTTEAKAATAELRQLVGGDKRKLPPLTRKQAAFVRELIENPKQPAVAAAQKTYGKPGKEMSYNTANAMAVENMRKPAIMSYLHDRAFEAEHAVVEVMEKNRSMAHIPANGALVLASAREILDRVHGKATQRVETSSTSVIIGIDLSKKVDVIEQTD